jgi:hypothetical protein
MHPKLCQLLPAMESECVVPSRRACIDLNDRKHLFLNYTVRLGEIGFPVDHDIVSIVAQEDVVSAAIIAIHVNIGGMSMVRVPRCAVRKGENILLHVLRDPDSGLPTSLSGYQHIDIMFELCEEELARGCDASEVDEETNELVVSDTECDFYIQGQRHLHRGNRVHTRTVKTGHKITKHGPAFVNIPELTIHGKKGDLSRTDTNVMIDVWEGEPDEPARRGNVLWFRGKLCSKKYFH